MSLSHSQWFVFKICYQNGGGAEEEIKQLEDPVWVKARSAEESSVI